MITGILTLYRNAEALYLLLSLDIPLNTAEIIVSLVSVVIQTNHCLPFLRLQFHQSHGKQGMRRQMS